MTIGEFIQSVEQQMGFTPTADQHNAISQTTRFLASRSENTVMIMCGSAGTGKTSLVSALVRTLGKVGKKMVLLAPTGRAAKVLSLYCGRDAFTIHRRIYRERSAASGGGIFNINANLHTDTLFIVDEASMIANSGLGDSTFGTGCLLDDLIQYVYSGNGCQLMLVGDTAQLPPVGEEESPALSADILMGYGLTVFSASLNQVVRQAEESGILYNATMIRALITHNQITQLPRIHLSAFADISVVPGSELIESLSDSYSHVGTDDTIVITRSNKTARIYNLGIRSTVLDRADSLLSTGDRLMIVKNHYPTADKKKCEERLPFAFIANGDCCRVVKVRHQREMHGFTFADVWLQFPDYNNYEYYTTVVLDSLTTDTPALTHQQSEQLYQSVASDYADLSRKADRMQAIRKDPYYNALQIKFAYAITCHKAQGGQWAHVYLDQGYMTDDMLTPDYIHWLYTAFTRATQHLYLVNWRNTQIAGSK